MKQDGVRMDSSALAWAQWFSETVIELAVTQDELASAAGVSTKTINSYLTQTTAPGGAQRR